MKENYEKKKMRITRKKSLAAKNDQMLLILREEIEN